LGQGTTVTLALPLVMHKSNSVAVRVSPKLQADELLQVKPADIDTAQDNNIVSLTGARFRRANILLVEDNIVNQEVATEYLRAMGCSVTIASDGQDGLASYKTGAFDLVLMDGLMPVMDGLQATRSIRELEGNTTNKRVPIIALTANAFPKDRDNCVAAGMDDVLSKPFDYEELAGMIKKWLPFQHEASKAVGM
jgi:CheY-like chemotaxis protein